jgi:hypothetical protein
LVSYGVTPSVNANEREQRELAEAFDRALPRSHRGFFAGLRTSFACGDYFFVHAGVRPGVPLSGQHEQDLLWIREEFLLHEEGFDTGAYATGRLTCLVLEGDDMTFI